MVLERTIATTAVWTGFFRPEHTVHTTNQWICSWLIKHTASWLSLAFAEPHQPSVHFDRRGIAHFLHVLDVFPGDWIRAGHARFFQETSELHQRVAVRAIHGPWGRRRDSQGTTEASVSVVEAIQGVWSREPELESCLNLYKDH